MIKIFTIISSVLLFTMTTMPRFGLNFRHVVASWYAVTALTTGLPWHAVMLMTP